MATQTPDGAQPRGATRFGRPRPRATQLLGLVVLGAVAGLVASLSHRQFSAACASLEDCSEGAFAFSLAALTGLVLAAGMLALRLPRRDLVALALVGPAALGAASVLADLAAWSAGFPDAAVPTPWWAWCLTLPVLLLAAWLTAGSARVRTVWRVLIPLVVVALLVGTHSDLQGARRSATTQRIAAAGLHLYLPDIPGATVTSVEAAGRGVIVHYEAVEPSSFPVVRLIPATTGTCAAVAQLELPGFASGKCSGEAFITYRSRWHIVGLRRDDTIVVAYDDDNGVPAPILWDAIRLAPEVDADRLAAAPPRA